jgi:hypothetical protein
MVSDRPNGQIAGVGIALVLRESLKGRAARNAHPAGQRH